MGSPFAPLSELYGDRRSGTIALTPIRPLSLSDWELVLTLSDTLRSQPTAPSNKILDAAFGGSHDSP